MSAQFVVAVCFVIVRGGEVLLLRRSSRSEHAAGHWETGSGRLEVDEDPASAVLREVHEETGLVVGVDRILNCFHFRRGSERQPAVGITFGCQYVSGAVNLSNEHSEHRWVEGRDLRQYQMLEAIYETIEGYLANSNKPTPQGFE